MSYNFARITVLKIVLLSSDFNPLSSNLLDCSPRCVVLERCPHLHKAYSNIIHVKVYTYLPLSDVTTRKLLLAK